ncbi:TPA: DUF86 domain-containing protein [Candidatus Woesearchaeota archaeon]|nr:DUF86 domain-containing protein [Candidatus Woesearchaeota archaeon]
MNRITDKIKEIEQYLSELKDIVPQTLEEYSSDNLSKAACERYFEKVIEAATDLAFLVIAKNKFRLPDDDIDAFKILSEKKIISEELCKKLKDAKGMRNILAHQYGRVEDNQVFEAVTEQLENDINMFIKEIIGSNK